MDVMYKFNSYKLKKSIYDKYVLLTILSHVYSAWMDNQVYMTWLEGHHIKYQKI